MQPSIPEEVFEKNAIYISVKRPVSCYLVILTWRLHGCKVFHEVVGFSTDFIYIHAIPQREQPSIVLSWLLWYGASRTSIFREVTRFLLVRCCIWNWRRSLALEIVFEVRASSRPYVSHSGGRSQRRSVVYTAHVTDGLPSPKKLRCGCQAPDHFFTSYGLRRGDPASR